MTCSVLAVGSVALVGCPSGGEIPGQTLGTYEFVAEPVVDARTCQLAEILTDSGAPGAFPFTATLSQDESDPTRAYLTIDRRTRDGTYEEPIFSSGFSAERRFEQCECDSVALEETMRVILISRSQNEALGDVCPSNPFGGGVPAPGSAPGIVGPTRTGGTFDSLRACGELVDVVVPGEGCACAPCEVRYVLSGARRQQEEQR